MLIKNDRGGIYPLVLIICTISLLFLLQASVIYLSELQYIREIKNYYYEEIYRKMKKIEENGGMISFISTNKWGKHFE